MKYQECIDPFDPDSSNLFVRTEHLARYLFAAEFARRRRLRRVLDCACGGGYGSRIMAGQSEIVAARDYNPELVEQARRDCAAKGFVNIDCQCSNLNDGLPDVADGFFDCAVCFETLEHIGRDEALLREFARVLRRGGWLLVSAPKAGYEPADAAGKPENPWHLRLYEPEGLKALLARCGIAAERELGQPFSNELRVRAEDYRRDTGASAGAVDRFFKGTPEALEFYARLWAWPVMEAREKSNTVLFLCKKT